MNKKTPSALVFDIDDTLYDQLTPLTLACRDALGYAIPDPDIFFDIFCRRSKEMFFANKDGLVSLHQSRLYRIFNTMKDMNIPFTMEMAEIFQKSYSQKQEQLFLSPTLATLLSDCKNAGITMAVLTNGPSQHQKKKFLSLGLEQWIPPEHLLISADADAAKPSPVIFRLMENILQIDREQICMIGDSLENDISGASGVGWQTIWMNRHKYAFPESGITPTHIVHSDQELSELIHSIFQNRLHDTELPGNL